MTITPINSNNHNTSFVVANTKSIENAGVVLLLENHSSRADFTKIEETLTHYYNHSTDLILLECPRTANRDSLLEKESKVGPWRIKVLQDKNIAGWDHPLSEVWYKNYLKSPDVIDFTQAVKTLEHLSVSDDTDDVYRSFETLVRGLRYLKKNTSLMPPSEYKNYIEKREYNDETFIKLKDKLISTGKEILSGLASASVNKIFRDRQDSLLQTLKLRIPEIKSNSGKVFVIMGIHHGNPFESPFPKEVQKVIDFLADKYLFISL